MVEYRHASSEDASVGFRLCCLARLKDNGGESRPALYEKGILGEGKRSSLGVLEAESSEEREEVREAMDSRLVESPLRLCREVPTLEVSSDKSKSSSSDEL